MNPTPTKKYVRQFFCVCLITGCTAATNVPLVEQTQSVRKSLIENTNSYLSNPDDEMANGFWNQAVTMVGREDLLHTSAMPLGSSSVPVCVGDSEDIIGKLVEAASQTSIVIINENHARPHDRTFVWTLARALRDAGFTHYAAEAFSDQTPLRASGVTMVDDGYYTQEPVFGRLLQDVRSMGYTLVAYEQTKEQAAPDDANFMLQIEAREKAQVENLLANLLRKNPGVRVLIHVGHSHVAEKPVPMGAAGSIEWMAARLKAATGIDPLTISQTACEASGSVPVLSTSYLAVDGKTSDGFTDYLVGLPAVTFKNSRPDYRRRMGDQEIEVPISLVPVLDLVVIEARRPGEDEGAVPVERLYLRPGERIPLMLPQGRFEISSFDKKGRVTGPVSLTVD